MFRGGVLVSSREKDSFRVLNVRGIPVTLDVCECLPFRVRIITWCWPTGKYELVPAGLSSYLLFGREVKPHNLKAHLLLEFYQLTYLWRLLRCLFFRGGGGCQSFKPALNLKFSMLGINVSEKKVHNINGWFILGSCDEKRGEHHDLSTYNKPRIKALNNKCSKSSHIQYTQHKHEWFREWIACPGFPRVL